MKHRWRGNLLGGGGSYLHCTATTPFETVCKQFVNGSVPFGCFFFFSLNSGFDTGNDSWFSRGACQEGAHLSRNTRQVLCRRDRARGEGPEDNGHHFHLGLGLRGGGGKKKKKESFLEEEVRTQGGAARFHPGADGKSFRTPTASNRLPSSGREDI